MGSEARVDSIDALKGLRAGVLKFMEAADQATLEADAEIERTLDWVRREQTAYWRSQIRRRTEQVQLARQDLSRKRMSFTASGRPPSTVDEEKALAAALRRLEEAENKARAVKVWARRLEKERIAYKASTGPLRTLIEGDLPKAVREVDRMLDALDAYLTLQPPVTEDVPDRAGPPPARRESSVFGPEAVFEPEPAPAPEAQPQSRGQRRREPAEVPEADQAGPSPGAADPDPGRDHESGNQRR